MKENTWEHVQSGTHYGNNTILGSPRGWLQRAIGHNQADLGQHETSLDPKKITVAGIWPRTQTLPDTGTWPALYRFFRITDNLRRIGRARPEDFYPVIGMAVAVPADHMFHVYQEFRTTAEWVWVHWHTGAAQTTPLRSIRELDHAHLYSLFEQGQTKKQVSDALDISFQSVAYVYNKWEDGRPAKRQRNVTVDQESVAQDIKLGHGISDIARRYDISRTMVYKIKQKHGVK
jgi:hypothetical protein